MFEIAEKAKGMIMKLNEIQPAVSVAGMEDEAAIIGEIKNDLKELMSGTVLLPTVAESVLAASREDLRSCTAHLRGSLNRLATCMMVCEQRAQQDQIDRMINITMLAAETFVARASDYLGSRESFQTLFNEG